MRVRGLKRHFDRYDFQNPVSHPMRVRGLKPSLVSLFTGMRMSHPMRVRGLKLAFIMLKDYFLFCTTGGGVD